MPPQTLQCFFLEVSRLGHNGRILSTGLYGLLHMLKPIHLCCRSWWHRSTGWCPHNHSPVPGCLHRSPDHLQEIVSAERRTKTCHFLYVDQSVAVRLDLNYCSLASFKPKNQEQCMKTSRSLCVFDQISYKGYIYKSEWKLTVSDIEGTLSVEGRMCVCVGNSLDRNMPEQDL